MSQFVTKLVDETGRNGISWPDSVGIWKHGEGINRLETFAKNLDVSQAADDSDVRDTDLLNSVPTPWARLLLFESALYKVAHPSHRDAEDQWRGLLGVIALAGPLRLNLDIRTISLPDYSTAADGHIARAFIDLRPRHETANGDEERLKWDTFQMILVDNVVLGATSPRTLVFTGVSHQCPPSIPFRSLDNYRLGDPVAYYKKFNDKVYLGLLARWLENLSNMLQQNTEVQALLGTVPMAVGAGQQSRVDLLRERVDVWRKELDGTQASNVNGKWPERFTLPPYQMVIKSLPELPDQRQSDLFVQGRKDVVVCYREGSSEIVNSFGQKLVNTPLKVYDGRWVQANNPLPLPLDFMPATIKRIEDPTEFFEDKLIQVELPKNPVGVHYLSIGDPQISQMRYLYPFKPAILDYFNPAEISKFTRIQNNPDTSSISVELKIPLDNDRSLNVIREYPLASAIVRGTSTQVIPTAELAVWPSFTSRAWNRYFYYKSRLAKEGDPELDFEPARVTPSVKRQRGGVTWFMTTTPVEAFIGTVNEDSGLLLLNNNSIDPPGSATGNPRSLFWKVGVDFGSTHTRAFSLVVEKNGNVFETRQNATVQPIKFSNRARPLTNCDVNELRDAFMTLLGSDTSPERTELKTLLMMPETRVLVENQDKSEQANATDGATEWLPREGYVFTHWIYDNDYDANHLRLNLKWNSNKDNPELRSYLRCLMLMIQAEAAEQDVQVVQVAYTHPSVFTPSLVAKLKSTWQGLGNYLNTGITEPSLRVTVIPPSQTMTETVAVCRHLECDQDAAPASNTISLDVGGSTTDMAVWASNKLRVQESVKIAAGIVGSYLQSPDAKSFLNWFEGIMRNDPYNLGNFSLSMFESKPGGYGLMFNNLLSVTEWKGQLRGLIDEINSAPESLRLMSHIIYLFASLLYYSGLLARKAGLSQQQHESYNIWFCGKGGTLIEWIDGYDVLAQEMFKAGFYGPQAKPQQNQLTMIVDPQISRYPKEEVGRGLLAESELHGSEGRRIGLINPNPPSVTVGETGWTGLKWNDELTPLALKQLPDNAVPAMQDLLELNNFLEAFKKGEGTKAAAAQLRLDALNSVQFRTRLQKRLFGAAKGSVVTDIKKNETEALLEPLFITEIKVLLETATQNGDLFS